jgi:3-isopropylmalate/(R)-2-methylmalate dehydratase small subunit
MGGAAGLQAGECEPEGPHLQNLQRALGRQKAEGKKVATQASKVERISGRAIPLRGNDIDTDRIIPARYLKTITFDGLEEHVFEDDRRQLAERGATHPFDDTKFRGAKLLFAQANFGCGSSREHAPQAIARWGIGAIVAESYAEIFFGNSLMMGMPCVTAAPADLEKLLTLVESTPDREFTLDLTTCRLSTGDITIAVNLPEAVRTALTSGNWDATGQLVDRYEEVEAVAARLPYVSGWNA